MKSIDERLLELVQEDEELRLAILEWIHAKTIALEALAAWRQRR
jgi:hypothetical protein